MLRALGRGSAQSSSSGELLALGKELMAGARAMGSARSLQAALLYRARMAIALLTLCPPRRTNFINPPRIEVVGEPMAMLQAAGVGRSQTDAGSAAPDPILALFARPVKQGLGAER